MYSHETAIKQLIEETTTCKTCGKLKLLSNMKGDYCTECAQDIPE